MKNGAMDQEILPFRPSDDPDVVDFPPYVRGVQLLAAAGRPWKADSGDMLWNAILDTGSPVTIIPRLFVDRMGYQPVQKSRTLYTADGQALVDSPAIGPAKNPRFPQTSEGQPGKHYLYLILLGLPGLPLFPTYAISLKCSKPGMERRHITIGRDLLVRLDLRFWSNIPFDDRVEPDDTSRWWVSYGPAQQ